MQIPQNLSLQLSGTSNVTIVNANIKHIGASDNTVIKLRSSSMETYEVKANSTIYRYWHITMHIRDPQKAPVVGASVKIIDSNGTIITSGVTDTDGSFRLDKILETAVIDSAGVQRSLILEVLKDDYFVRRFTAEFTSGNITIELPIPTPWWQQYWYLLVILAIGIVSVIAFRTFRKSP